MPLCIEKRQFFTYFLSLCFGSVVAYGLVVIVKDFFKVVVSRMDDKRTISSNLLKQLLGNVGNYIPKPVDMQHMPLYFVALWVYGWNVLCELLERVLMGVPITLRAPPRWIWAMASTPRAWLVVAAVLSATAFVGFSSGSNKDKKPLSAQTKK